MAKNLIAKYIWIVDTIERHGSITRERLSELWKKSEYSNGEPLPRRSFYNYRNGIADTLGIDIEFNPSTYEYYIANDGTDTANKRQQWLLDSMSISGMVSGSADLSTRILLEYVPSAQVQLQELPTCQPTKRYSHRTLLCQDFQPVVVCDWI